MSEISSAGLDGPSNIRPRSLAVRAIWRFSPGARMAGGPARRVDSVTNIDSVSMSKREKRATTARVFVIRMFSYRGRVKTFKKKRRA
jgi:hypothetical protein